MENKENYSHILKYTGLFGGIQGLGILISLVRNKLVAVILGPQGMGLISLFNSTITLISNSTNLGLPLSSVRNISEAFEKGDEESIIQSVRVVRSWTLFTAVAGMLVCVISAYFLDAVTFSYGNHILHFILLSPIVGFTAITGGEMAILKGLRKLRGLAVISICNVVIALVTTVPLYYIFGLAGIIPSLIIVSLTQMILTARYSYRLYPLRISFNRTVYSVGLDMVKLGIAFLLGGVFTSGAEFAIRSYFNSTASLDVVGLYNAGYIMTFTYAGMIFSAMETDYFPRLSAVNKDVSACNLIVNRQIEVSVLLISPMLVFFVVSLPVVIPFLFSGKFIPVIGMLQVTVMAMFLRAIKLPVAYLTLAKGDSRAFLVLEAYSAFLTVGLVIVGYEWWGLVGAGVGLFMAELVDTVVVNIFASRKYRYRCTFSAFKYSASHLFIAAFTFLCVRVTDGWVYWLSGVFMIVVSAAMSIWVLRKKTSLFSALRNKFIARWHNRF